MRQEKEEEEESGVEQEGGGREVAALSDGTLSELDDCCALQCEKERRQGSFTLAPIRLHNCIQ